MYDHIVELKNTINDDNILGDTSKSYNPPIPPIPNIPIPIPLIPKIKIRTSKIWPSRRTRKKFFKSIIHSIYNIK